MRTALPLPEESGWSVEACAQAQAWKRNYPAALFKAHCMETELAVKTIQSKGYAHTIDAYTQARLLDEHSVLIHNCKAFGRSDSAGGTEPRSNDQLSHLQSKIAEWRQSVKNHAR